MADFGTAAIHEAAGRIGDLHPLIRAVTGGHLAGVAITVICPPGDNLTLHHAIYVAEPGDVIVCTVSDAPNCGYWGEVMTVAALERGVAGLVIDGGVRDLERIRALGFPVFAPHVCMHGTSKHAFGRINHPLVIGGVLVSPGDIVIGDCDGVVVVGSQELSRICAEAEARKAKERWLVDELRKNRTTLDLLGLPRVSS